MDVIFKNRYDVITLPWIAWLRVGWSKITYCGQNRNRK